VVVLCCAFSLRLRKILPGPIAAKEGLACGTNGPEWDCGEVDCGPVSHPDSRSNTASSPVQRPSRRVQRPSRRVQREREAAQLTHNDERAAK
ncbi:MAG TPA: hypothetical protein QF761_05465, partial [Pirellulales bacterium]|nr:hypothetical protein [Pirellulales bacterium]